MKCPRCGADDLYRDSVDVGIGVMYGPYGCPCGWSEYPRFDITDGPKTDSGWRVDQWGGLTPPADHHARLAAGTEWVCESCGYHNNGGICTHCGRTAAGTEEG